MKCNAATDFTWTFEYKAKRKNLRSEKPEVFNLKLVGY